MLHFKYVEDAFHDELRRLFAQKPEVFNFLNNHERKSVMFNNLKSEIVTAELKSATFINQKSLKMIGKEFAKTFSELALRAKEKEYTSEAEIQRRLHNAHQFNEIQEMIEQNSKDYLEGVTRDGKIIRTEI